MKKQSNFKIMLRLISLIKPLVRQMVLAVFMGVLGFLCAISITVLGGTAVLDIMDYPVILTLTTACILSVLFGVLRGFFKYGEQALNHYIAFKLLALIRDKVFTALRRLCPAKLEGKDKGNLISVITSDIELLEVFYAHTVSPVVIAFIVSTIMVIFISSCHLLLGLIALMAYITVGILVPFIASKTSGNSAEQFRSKSGDLSSFVLDSMRGIKESIQYGAGKNKLDELDKRTDRLSYYEKRQKMNIGKNIAITNTIILIFDVALLVTGAFLYSNGTIGFDALLLSVVAMMSSFGPVIALANLGSTLQNTFAAARRVLDILDEEPLVKDIAGKEKTVFKGASLENVTFSYNESLVLSNVSLGINQNRVVGIVGKSGSGKSTILKLLMRFWNVKKGRVKISGKDINEINTSDLREMEGYVTQETHLFYDSIEKNLRIAKQDATMDEIIDACKKASVHDFIMSLPKGYSTPVGELGSTLSGGERQRIGLARIFLHDAPFILLDEPTSNLDSLNEAIILKSLIEARGSKTVVLVSHRESTMKIADTVYNIENGRIS